MNKIKKWNNELRKRGFYHIFFSTVINNVISLCSGMFIVRILSVYDYGLYSFSANLIQLFLLLNGLGTASAVLQMNSENDDKEMNRAFLKFGFKIGMSFNTISTVVIVLYALFIPLAIPDAQGILTSMCFIPSFAYIIQVIGCYYRANFQNKEYSFTRTVASVLSLVGMIVGGYLFGVYGVVLGNYFSYIVSIIVMFAMTKELLGIFNNKTVIDKAEKKAFLKISILSTITNGFSQLLYIADVYVVGRISLSALTIAAYKTGTTLPNAIRFVPSAIIMFVYPYFAKNKNDIKWVKSNYRKLLFALSIISSSIALIMFAFAPQIISLIFTNKYQESIIIMRILLVGFVINSVLRLPAGNVLLTQRKINFNLVESSATGILNLILDFILVSRYGYIGAALASVAVQLISGIMSTTYLWFFVLKGEKHEKNCNNI